MEIVVLNSDIARLVLGYLKNQQLERASRVFCKTSPHLRQEFSAYRQGLQAHSFFPDLEQIICEYVKITRKMEQLLPRLPPHVREQVQQTKLSDRVSELLERGVQSLLRAEVNANAANVTNEPANSSISVQSDKENNANKKISEQRRKRKMDSLVSPSDENKKFTDISGAKAKRRRILEPFCYLSTKKNLTNSPGTSDDLSASDSVEDEQEEEQQDECYDDVYDEESFDGKIEEISILEKPTKESTPHNKSKKEKYQTPTLPELSQAILDNPEFQLKLVQNINQALHKTKSSTEPIAVETKQDKVQPNISFEEQEIIQSNQLLDEMVKRILDATEKDPTFDAIIDDVVGGAKNKSLVSAAVQCDIEPSSLTAHATIQLNADPIAALPSTAIATMPPRTPLIIRTAVAAASALNNNDPQAPISTSLSVANNSFGSLIDPNFSISKLIVLNSNDSAHKQPPGPDTSASIGNTTADHLINQLTTATETMPLEDQVCFDASTGQLTFPLFLTNDGLLANFPFLINNEVVTQQLQPDNIANMDGTRIEIPLPEPIIVSADQLPPNSIIFGSTQKGTSAEPQPPQQEQPVLEAQQQEAVQQPTTQRTVFKMQKEFANCTAVPSSLDSRLNVERVTPSTSGIINVKAYKSLSTPRKRAPHVRTLTFSPRTTTVPLSLVDGTPVTTRKTQQSRFQRLSKTVSAEEKSETVIVSEKPIIKNIEILPRLAATATSIDGSANESSNSCSVPPLFAGDESSNMTVIKGDSSLKESSTTSVVTHVVAVPEEETEAIQQFYSKITKTLTVPSSAVDTPKRKQQRRKAVRACKRQLSKDHDEEETERNNAHNDEAEGKPENNELKREETPNIDSADSLKSQKDEMMEEWLRMRNTSTCDLDSRLRELNAKTGDLRPIKREVKKKTRGRRKKLLAKKKEQNSFVETKQRTAKLCEVEAGDKIMKSKETSAIENKDALKVEAKIKDKKRANKDKSKEFNIKIPTPQKLSSAEKSKEKREESKQSKTTNTKHQERDAKINMANDENVFQMPQTAATTAETEIAVHLDKKLHNLIKDDFDYEREKRTANIACLLETPFKEGNISHSIPPTPGIFLPSLEETPLSKMRATDEVLHSASFLFGSLTKSELNTPMLTAVTPGFGLTPFMGSSDATPRSVSAVTEYSSGGSYYRPDESEDLDRNIDKMLRKNSEQKPAAKGIELLSQAAAELRDSKFEIVSNNGKIDANVNDNNIIISSSRSSVKEQSEALCVEIHAEELKVEPIVLKRVKSFGSEAVDSVADAKIDPHYTLAAGLPDISAEEDESSSSSSSNSSSSSSSSSSSPSSSSSSSSSSTTSTPPQSPPASAELGTLVTDKANVKTPQKPLTAALSLENLSEISSTEDEEWQKLAVTEAEDSQLVSNDGEVRYPVRSWLTPSKNQALYAKMTTIRVTYPLKSVEKRNRQLSELEQKRERMKEKLKLDNKQQAAHSPTAANKTAAVKIITKVGARKPASTKREKPPKRSTISAPTMPIDKAEIDTDKKCTIDVLTALNLSAKKQSQKADAINNSESRVPPLGEIDDNAVSNIFDDVSANSSKEKAEPVQPKSTIAHAKQLKQRKCMQIDALPASSTTRLNAKQKKIVRTPLGFKGPSAKTPTLASAVAEDASTLETLVVNKTDITAAPAAVKTAVKVSPITQVKLAGAAIESKTNLKPSKCTGKSTGAQKKLAMTTKKAKITKTPPIAAISGERRTRQSEQQKQVAIGKIAKMKEQLRAANTAAKAKTAAGKLQSKEQKVRKAKTKSKMSNEKLENMESGAVMKVVGKSALSEEPKVVASVSTIPSISEENVNVGNKEFKVFGTMPPVSEENTNLSDDEDDPLEGCELTTFTENDKKHFLSVVYNGPDEAPKEPKIVPADFANFKMVVAFDEHEKHTWQISKEICLFSCDPVVVSGASTVNSGKVKQTIRNIPKKRKIRITTTSSGEDSDCNKQRTSITDEVFSSNIAKVVPAATSTPVQMQTAAVSTSVSITQATHSINASPSGTTSAASNTESVNAAEKIKIEDIESILSHIHGT